MARELRSGTYGSRSSKAADALEKKNDKNKKKSTTAEYGVSENEVRTKSSGVV